MLGRKKCEFVQAPDIQREIKRSKRYRSAFTTGQINYLEAEFRKCPYIENDSRKKIANVLNITERAIKIWFQNRRMKEKKETNNKEYKSDRPNNSINNVELTNDSLNNFHSSQSANDLEYSLQPLTSIYIKNHNDEFDRKKSNLIKFEKCKPATTDKKKCYTYDNCYLNNEKSKYTNKKNSSEKDDLSKYNLSKLYNNRNFTKYLEKNNNKDAAKNKALPQMKRKTEKEIHSTIMRGCQDLPEDLSARSTSTVMVSQNHPGNVNFNAAYIPLCNTQNYFPQCISTGNILWKPVNAVPVVPNGLPIVLSKSPLSGNQDNNTQKKKCSCDCHLKTSLTNNQENKISTPQYEYMIAVPYNNYSRS